MKLFNENNILSQFEDLPFSVNGIGVFKQIGDSKVVCIDDCGENKPIGLDQGCNGGYLRYNSDVKFTKNDMIDCDTPIYIGEVEIVAVIGVLKYTIDSLIASVMFKIGEIKNVTIKSLITNKEKIIAEEIMHSNDLNLFKVVFDYKFDYIKPCEDDRVECIC